MDHASILLSAYSCYKIHSPLAINHGVSGAETESESGSDQLACGPPRNHAGSSIHTPRQYRTLRSEGVGP
eukprot:3513362-Rhodomonas_salina.4